MLKVVIFDFDLTLFDSTLLKPFMDKRQWSLVYKNIPKCSFYPSTLEVLGVLKENNIKIAIVSNAPSAYVTKALDHYKMSMDYLICYHDVKKHKPSPEGIHKVLDFFSCSVEEAIYIGDNDIDYNAAKNSKINFFGVPWGSFSKEVKRIDWDLFINHIIVNNLHEFGTA